MINVNILNNLIKGISEQIPLVHSYYTTSPYESWNVEEVKYGSVSFVITKVNTRETTTTFDATIYYADRLLEDNSNRDSVHSDAATVIQTIVGALNTADEYLEVSYPVGITLFEQDFADKLAGGYAQVSISAEGMGECFEDEFSVPEIIATSAYYTKDEINQFFPLRTELSTVAFTGAYKDLIDKPDIVSQQQYNDLYTAVKESTEALSEEMKQKINVGQYNAFTDEVKSYIEGVPSKQDFSNLTQAVIDSTSSLAAELDKKVNVDYFDTWADGIEADLANRPTVQNFDILKKDLTDQIDTINRNVNTKVNSAYFENWKTQTESTLSNKATQQSVDTLRQDITDQIDVINRNVNDKVGSAYFENWKAQTESALNAKASSQALNNLSNELNSTKNSLQQQIDKKVTEDEVNAILGDISSEVLATKTELKALESEVDTNAKLTAAALDSKVNVNTFNAFKETITEQTGNGVTKQDFDNLTQAVAQSSASLAAELDKKVNVNYFDGWADGIEAMIDNKVSQQAFDSAFSNVYNKTQTYSKYEIDRKLDNVVVDGDIDLSGYYTKEEVDDIISNIDTNDIDLSDYAKKTDVYTKTQTYSKPEIDYKLANIEVSVDNIDLSKYPTKAELEASYYTKSQIDDKLDEIETGGTVDLSNYYKKSETYSKSEIDATLGNINTILNDILYNK